MIGDRIIPLFWLLTACVIIGAAIGTQAKADPVDPATVFAVRYSETICQGIGHQPTFAGLVGVMQAIEDTGLSTQDAGGATALAVIATCPEHLSLLRRFVAAYGPKGVAA